MMGTIHRREEAVNFLFNVHKFEKIFLNNLVGKKRKACFLFIFYDLLSILSFSSIKLFIEMENDYA